MRTPQDVATSRLIPVLVITCFFGGSDFVVTRMALDTLPPFLFAGARCGLAGLLVCGWLLARGGTLPTARQAVNALVVSLFLIVGGNGLRTFGQTMTGAGVSAIIMAMGPLFLTLLGVLSGMERKPSPRVWGYLGGGFAGIALILLPKYGAAPVGGGHALVGALIVLAACLFWAVGSLFSRRGVVHPDCLMAAGLHLLMAAPVLLLMSGLLGEWRGFHPSALPWMSYALLAYMVVSFASYFGFIWLLRHATFAVASSCVYFNPVIALLLSWLFLGEKLGATTVAGCALVVSMLVLLLRHKNLPESFPEEAEETKNLIVKAELGLCETRALAHPVPATPHGCPSRVAPAPETVRSP